MEVARCSLLSVSNYTSTRLCIPEDRHLHYVLQKQRLVHVCSWSVITTARRVLKLLMKRGSICGGQLRIYWINRCWEPRRGFPLLRVWAGLTILLRKSLSFYGLVQRAKALFFWNPSLRFDFFSFFVVLNFCFENVFLCNISVATQLLTRPALMSFILLTKCLSNYMLQTLL